MVIRLRLQLTSPVNQTNFNCSLLHMQAESEELVEMQETIATSEF